ncbi:HD domain-containing protein [Desulfobotulus mexicanus]|uniref:HD domain-containing protein n=1 Tax=Desulfobotulus mexicanus TaxID=2586642 RepID=A0A5S5MFP2_9BACT|nr:HD domain-containing protein [Desulfobotulus mexicanus]TYT74533.1 HD domain-containing protein [Desulfobotulus mexicanus]
MQAIYYDIREMARAIVHGAPTPAFYSECAFFLEKSCIFFEKDAKVAGIRDKVMLLLAEDWGHGMGHSRKVAVEAGALIFMEGMAAGFREEACLDHLMRLAQCAGLLHDICRKEKNHAEKGAVVAGFILEEEGFSSKDVEAVCEAIRRHEAFRHYPEAEALSLNTDLLVNCLYDADKFRWGPDNFTHTVWDMLASARVPVSAFLKGYPQGIAGIARIRETFRSHSGRRFGPEFIDIGMGIAARVYVAILERYGRDAE